MDEMTMAGLGLVEIGGADVLGGGAWPYVLPFLAAAVGAVANNWAAFKEDALLGLSAGASGCW